MNKKINNKTHTFNKSKLTLAVFFATSCSLISSQSFAADLVASSTSPQVTFIDTTLGNADPTMRIENEGGISFGSMLFQDLVGANNHNVITYSGTEGITANENSLTIDSLGNVILGDGMIQLLKSNNSPNSMVVDSSGDINLADGSVFIDRSANRMGIGTIIPDDILHLETTSSSFRFLMETSATKWNFNPGSSGFWLRRDSPSAANPVKIQNDSPNDSLVANAIGIGMGTVAPETALHVKRDDAVVTVEDTASGGVKNILQLKRPGSVGFVMEDTALGQAWDFRTAGNGGFLVSNIGVPGSKIQVNLDGSVFLNGGGFSLNGNSNNVIVAGTHTAVQHIASSSREVKKDFAKVDGKAVMDKIKNLEVTEWRYKDEAAQGKHIGPMAEDFYNLFNLGADDKHVSATDMASIAIVAAKELQKKSEAIRSETQALKAENTLLKERLASLEKLVSNLASSGNTLPEKGDNIAELKKQ